MKKIITYLIFFLGIPDIFRFIFQRNKTTIIYYHNINSTLFSYHLNFLSKKYSIVSLNDYVNNSIPKKVKYRLIITFDDGYKENYHIQNILASKNLYATIFLTSSIVNTNVGLWFKSKISKQKKQKLKQFSNEKRIRHLEENGIFCQHLELSNRTGLNLDEIKKMNNFSFGSHTINHPCLEKCNDLEAYEEIVNSKFILEEKLKKPIEFLAFPDGSYTKRDVEIAKSHGYRVVLNSMKGLNSFTFNSFELKRYSITDSCKNIELYLRATGLWYLLRKLDPIKWKLK